MSEPNLYDELAAAIDRPSDPIRAWLSLLTCFSTVERALMRRFAQEFESGLPRYDVLTALALYPEGLTMGQLADKLMVTRGNVTGIVRRLEQDRLAKKSVSSRDRRVQRVTMTPAGRKLWERMKNDYEQLIAELLSGLAHDEADALCRMLEDTRESIEQALDGRGGAVESGVRG